jgi:hypothetical protein
MSKARVARPPNRSLTPSLLPKNVSLESLTHALHAHTARDRVMTTASKDALLPQLLAPP